MDTTPPLAYPWEGPPSGIRSKVGRSSAAGGTFVGNPWHRMAGRDGEAVARTVCGLRILSEWGPTGRMKADEPRCSACWS